MPKADRTELAIILDRSGSMQEIRDDMQGGLLAFLDSQRALPGECVVSLYQFDDVYEVVHEATLLGLVPKPMLEPRGSTALLDAVGKSVARIRGRHDALPESERPSAVVVLVITDGHENASVEWTLPAVKKAVQLAQTERNWRFVFLGADADAFDDAAGMGMGTAARYARVSGSVKYAYEALGRAVGSYRGAVLHGAADAEVDLPKDLTGAEPAKKPRKRPTH